jgi:L-aminopeptidase/D-esterase-like protein
MNSQLTRSDAITAVEGIRVGHAHDREALTGCTVVLCDRPAVAGMEIRGGATSTRQIDSLLSPHHIVESVHAVLLTGGSAFGLDAAGGVMRYLESQGKGFTTSVGPIPIVPAAVIYDLALGMSTVRPDPEMGYQACGNAVDGTVEEGSVGVGMGATVGKLCGIGRAMKGGVGTAAVRLNYLVVGSVVVVNSFGDVLDEKDGTIIAGLRDSEPGSRLIGSAREMMHLPPRGIRPYESTVLSIVATNARLTRAEASHVARMISGCLGKNISPVHTQFDGDIVFVLSLGNVEADINVIGTLGGEIISEAIQRAVKKADGFGIIPAWKDLR